MGVLCGQLAAASFLSACARSDAARRLASCLLERLPPCLHGARCDCPSSDLRQEPPSWQAHQRRRGSSQALPKAPAGLQQPSACTSLLPCTVYGVASPPAAWSKCFPLSIPTGSGERAAGRFSRPQLACSSPQRAPSSSSTQWLMPIALQQLAADAFLSACTPATATKQRALPGTPAGLQQPSACTALLPCVVDGVTSPPAACSRCSSLSLHAGDGGKAARHFLGHRLACSSPPHALPFFLAWWMV